MDTIKSLLFVAPGRPALAQTHVVNMAKWLIDQLDDINAVDQKHRTLLHYAASYNNPAIVDHLLKRGACDTIMDGFSLTPFVLAWAEGHIECACLLGMANPRIVDFQDPFWRSPVPTRCDDPYKLEMLVVLMDLMRRGISLWDWVCETLSTQRAAHAALGLDHEIGKGALLQRYAYACPVREAILMCLVPSTLSARTLVSDLHRMLAPFCAPELDECFVAKKQCF
jgi:ankyrin repeat protein